MLKAGTEHIPDISSYHFGVTIAMLNDRLPLTPTLAKAVKWPHSGNKENFLRIVFLNEIREGLGKTTLSSQCRPVRIFETASPPSSFSRIKGLPQNLWIKTLDIAPLQRVGFFALLKKQADMLERSQGLPKQPLACFLTPMALELVPTSALSSTEASQ